MSFVRHQGLPPCS